MDNNPIHLMGKLCMYDMMQEGALCGATKTSLPNIYCGCSACCLLRKEVAISAPWVLKTNVGPSSTYQSDCIWKQSMPAVGKHSTMNIVYNKHTRGPWRNQLCSRCTTTMVFANKKDATCAHCYLARKTNTLSVVGAKVDAPYFAPRQAKCSVCDKTIMYRKGLVRAKPDAQHSQCMHTPCLQLATLEFLQCVFLDPFEDVLFAQNADNLLAPLVAGNKLVSVYSRSLGVVLCFADAPTKYKLYVSTSCVNITNPASKNVRIKCATVDPSANKEAQLMDLYFAGVFPEEAAKKVHKRITALMS